MQRRATTRSRAWRTPLHAGLSGYSSEGKPLDQQAAASKPQSLKGGDWGGKEEEEALAVEEEVDKGEDEEDGDAEEDAKGDNDDEEGVASGENEADGGDEKR